MTYFPNSISLFMLFMCPDHIDVSSWAWVLVDCGLGLWCLVPLSSIFQFFSLAKSHLKNQTLTNCYLNVFVSIFIQSYVNNNLHVSYLLSPCYASWHIGQGLVLVSVTAFYFMRQDCWSCAQPVDNQGLRAMICPVLDRVVSLRWVTLLG
jgi:hypothetical protein